MEKIISAVTLALLSITLIVQPVSAQQEQESGAKVILTEYSDYQCPACGYFHPIVEKLKAEYGDKLKVNYRYFPLNSHQFAALAARAAEAARNQGKFKQMHDLLFENQRYWSSSGNPMPIFMDFARDLDLDLDQFREELNSGETQRVVMEEKRKGQNRGVNSTPTFFINGDKLDSLPRSYESFRAIIDSYMQEMN